MTLLIAYVLFAHFDFGFWAYFWTFWLWALHVFWHHTPTYRISTGAKP